MMEKLDTADSSSYYRWSVTCSPIVLVHKESLFQFCPSLGRAANSIGVSPLRLECGRFVLYNEA